MGLMGCRVNMSKLLLLTVCAFGLLFSSALAQAQCTYRMNDVGRFRGYLSGPCNGHALGYAGHSQLALIQPRKPTQPRNTPKSNHCDWLCQRKCQATWQAGGLPKF
jgi:hypothetical protein